MLMDGADAASLAPRRPWLRARQELGDHIDQKGSMVSPERLRFDFSHGKPIEPGALARIEATCRGQLLDALRIYARDVPLAEARQINGARCPALSPSCQAGLGTSSASTAPVSAAAHRCRRTHCACPSSMRLLDMCDSIKIWKWCKGSSTCLS